MNVTTAAEDSPGVAAALPALHAVLSRSSSARVRRAAGAVVLGYTAAQATHRAWRYARRSTEYRVSIPGDDLIYDRAHAWVVDSIPTNSGRSLRVHTRRRSDAQEVAPSGDVRTTAGFHLAYDGERAQSLLVEGHRVRVHVERESLGGNERIGYSYMLVFTTHTVAARGAVVRVLRDIHEQVTKAAPCVRVADTWGGWRRILDVPARPLDSVILPARQREAIVADLAHFLAGEADHIRWGMPWHRGYLFSGPPGTGKTSVATALAAHFGLDVYYIGLSTLRGDDNLLNLLAGVEPRSVLVIEDVDIAHASKARDDAGTTGVTLTGLLNALDGMLTPHGLVTILTTNDRDVLDPALVRPGRVDFEWASTAMDADQAARIGAYFGHPVAADEWAGRYPAELVSHLKRHEDGATP